MFTLYDLKIKVSLNFALIISIYVRLDIDHTSYISI